MIRNGVCSSREGRKDGPNDGGSFHISRNKKGVSLFYDGRLRHEGDDVGREGKGDQFFRVPLSSRNQNSIIPVRSSDLSFGNESRMRPIMDLCDL